MEFELVVATAPAFPPMFFLFLLALCLALSGRQASKHASTASKSKQQAFLLARTRRSNIPFVVHPLPKGHPLGRGFFHTADPSGIPLEALTSREPAGRKKGQGSVDVDSFELTIVNDDPPVPPVPTTVPDEL